MASLFSASLAFFSSIFFFFSASCCSLSLFAFSIFSLRAALEEAELEAAALEGGLDDVLVFEAAVPGFLAVAPDEPVAVPNVIHRYIR